jgi:hypothetical protein
LTRAAVCLRLFAGVAVQVFILTDDQDRTLGENDYTHLGSLAVMPVVQAELIAKGAFLQNFFVNTRACDADSTRIYAWFFVLFPPGSLLDSVSSLCCRVSCQCILLNSTT